MKRYFLISVLLLSLVSCFGRYQNKTKISSVIPKSFHTLIKINNLDDTKTLSKFSFLSKDIYLNSVLKCDTLLKKSYPIYISISDSTLLFVSETEKKLVTNDSITTSKQFKIKNKGIFKTITENDTIYHREIKNLLLSSKKKDDLTTIKLEENLELEKLLSTLNDNASTSLIFNNSGKENNFFQEKKKQKGYQIMDITSSNDEINYNGITKSTDSSFYINAFKNTKPQGFNLKKIIPTETESFKRIAFDDFNIFKTNLNKTNSEEELATLYTLSNEIALIKNKDLNATAIHTLDSELTKGVFSTEVISETFKGISIFKVIESEKFHLNLSPFFEIKNTAYSFVYENIIVFASNIKTLKNIISSKLNNKTLSESDKFKSISQNLADESSYIIYNNAVGLSELINSESTDFNANAIQYIYDTDFAHINGVFSKFKKQNSKKTISDDFIVKIPNDILINPQVVKNKKGKSYSIAVQDVQNILYLISNNGNILWKKQLSSNILGDIKTIDSNKNGNYQLTFATQNKVYLLDNRGKDIGKFPLTFKDKITQPLSVFDYDNKKKYRLLVTQGKKLLMYDAKGKIVNGFKYKSSSNNISSQPKHFRINTKDYIVFSSGKRFQILNRQGQIRVKVNTDISFSKNEIYLYKNKFTTMIKNGQFVQVDTQGKTTYKNQNFSPETSLNMTSKTLVALTENELKIKSKTIDLDYGNYTLPKIFYLQDKIYVTTTDLQTKKVYLFDSQAKPIDNFPIFGTAEATLQNLDTKRDLELITQTDSKTIIVYKMS